MTIRVLKFDHKYDPDRYGVCRRCGMGAHGFGYSPVGKPITPPPNPTIEATAKK